jgi:hypothetical protein
MPSCASDDCRTATRWWRMRAPGGATLDGAWYCSQACVEGVVRQRLYPATEADELRPRLPTLRLGALLKHHRAVAPAALDRALQAQAASRLRLGEQLRTMGVVEPHALLRALAEQAGVSYLATVDLARVHDAPGALSLDAISAPDDSGRVRVAFPAPVPRTALAILRTQTGWTPEPYLVSDADWVALLEHYGARAIRRLGDGDLSMGFAREADSEAAARRLAQVVMAAGEARMRDARWGPYVWVRLQGAGAGFDLLLDVTPDAAALEGAETWPAATTSH